MHLFLSRLTAHCTMIKVQCCEGLRLFYSYCSEMIHRHNYRRVVPDAAEMEKDHLSHPSPSIAQSPPSRNPRAFSASFHLGTVGDLMSYLRRLLRVMGDVTYSPLLYHLSLGHSHSW